MEKDAFTMLDAALATGRMELLKMFKAILAEKAADNQISKKDIYRLSNVIEGLAKEVYDLKRTVQTMAVLAEHIESALGGIQGHLGLQTEVSERGQDGTLPEAHAPSEIIRQLKKGAI